MLMLVRIQRVAQRAKIVVGLRKRKSHGTRLNRTGQNDTPPRDQPQKSVWHPPRRCTWRFLYHKEMGYSFEGTSRQLNSGVQIHDPCVGQGLT